MTTQPNQSRILVPALVIVFGGGLLSLLLGYKPPVDVSLDGYRIDAALQYTTKLIVGYFLIVLAVLGYCLVRFRAVEGRKAHYTHGDRPVHLLLTGALAASVFGLVDMKLIHMANNDLTEAFFKYPTGADVLRVEVQGQQFEWHFRYPGADGKFNTADDVETNGVFHVPTGRPVHIKLRAKDVIHSLFIPNVRFKQDAIPGRTTQMWFAAKQTGDFELACAQLCGLGHYRMRGQFMVQEPKQFEQWLAVLAKEAAEEYDPNDKTTNWGWDWEAR